MNAMADPLAPPDGEPADVSRSVDVRLAGGALAGWLAVIGGLRWAPSDVLLCGLVALAAGVALLLLARHGLAVAAAAALAAFCVALLMLPLAARLARARDSPVAALARDHVAVTAWVKVTSDPRPLAATGPAGTARVAVDAVVESMVVSGRVVDARASVLVLGPASGWRDVLPGQHARLDARLQPPLGSDLLTAVLSEQSDPVLVGRPPWWQRAAGIVRTKLRTASAGLPHPVSGLLPGLVDGDTGRLDPVLAERFRIAGLTHLVAVSGTNCAILIGAALLALRRIGAGPLTCAAAGLVVLVAFVVVARPSPSVLRAAVMAAITLIALARGRQRDGVPMVSAAVLGLLLWRPQLAVDAGFAMSVLATGALLVIAPGWASALRRRRVPPGLAELVAVSAAAHVVTAPIIAAISGRVSVVAIPANMLAEPVVAAATVLGFCAAVTAPLCMPLAALLAQLAGVPCRWLVWVAEFFGGVHGATMPWPSGIRGGLALLAASLALWWLARRSGPRKFLAGAAVVALIVQIPVRSLVSGWPPPGWLLVACDVGQGDGLVLSAGDGNAVVVDAGPDPVKIDRCLADLHVRAVPLLILTHYHLDHVAGLVGIFHGRRVGAVLAGPLDEPPSGAEIVRSLLADHGLTVRPAVMGSRLDIGAVQLEILAPAVALHDTHSDPNNSSVVMRATVHGVRILLPGDAEIEEQDAVLAAGTDVTADVLKVPHHGSAYSDVRFLQAVHARLAVISVGLHNDYGHPSPLLLGELGALGLPVRRTDHDGDVAVVSGQADELSSVARGTSASAVGMGDESLPLKSHGRAAGTPLTVRAGPSPARVTMGPWQPTRSTASTSTVHLRRSRCSSGTRSSSLPDASSRSPPWLARPTRPSTSASAQVGRLTLRS